MAIKISKEDLAGWISELKKAAADDEPLCISFFSGTKDSPIAIVGGWEGGFDQENADLFCISKSNPTYAMSIKIAVNAGPYAYCDFEVIDMPVFKNDEVDDTCITLEWDDDPMALATFFEMELERIYSTYELGNYKMPAIR